ncbi:MAG TPA: family 20 glycosylhydrolase, partial [Chitinophagaceae bacterium]|nr:family 20 glycosylhydrolase [Chitinophagaceae bacterium]
MKKYSFIVSVCLWSFLSHAQQVIPLFQYQEASVSINDWRGVAMINSVDVTDPAMMNDVKVMNQYCKTLHVDTLKLQAQQHDAIILHYDAELHNDEYTIRRQPHNILDVHGSKDGLFYALMTIIQWKVNALQTPGIPSHDVSDHSAFRWRGMHLDVSRHFFSIEFVKRYIDLLAFHKMNVFHWHLTDDQGWRIEIKKYPRLTDIGSKRKETMTAKNFNPYVGDGKPVEGFYTQDQIREIVAYAAARHMTVVPEIEMPGHSLAALVAYPEYSCAQKNVDVFTMWGVSDDVFCPNPKTIRFLEDILDEVMELFPSTYIHIGGDEVPKARWEKCPRCQQTIKEQHLKNEHELQSYFIKQIDAYVTSKGRSIIGWDEILEGGLAPNAAVMSWRGEEGGIAAAKQQHKVVMTPGSHCYFDHYQGNKSMEPLSIGGFTPIEKVYAYSPIPKELSATEANFILGAQANLWTEYIASESHVEYMMLPRMCALSEVLWTGESRSDFENFKQRLRPHLKLLDRWGVHYATSVFNPNFQIQTKGTQKEISLSSMYRDGDLMYTTDGGQFEVAKAKKYTSPLPIQTSMVLQAAYVENGKPQGGILRQPILFHEGMSMGITSTIPPAKRYSDGGTMTLTNGIVGRLPWSGNEWLGWNEAY